MGGDEAAQLLAQRSDAGKDSPIQAAALQLREPPFYRVEPGRAGGSEVQLHARVCVKELLDRGRLMGAAVIEDDVQVQARWHRLHNLLQKADKLLAVVTLRDPSDDLSRGDVESRVQTRGAVTLIVVPAALDLARPQGKQGPSAIQGLDLRLLIDRQ